ncbi:hypothetical protein QYE76_029895 [Lolium multiflorum]|uniref:CCHC-type domain-containing protein n=1 Tax=Lolium multiflorum TaxID=4521 RepID=A0AAD8QRB8_LOLMU|nr:hypothetical protein QYE76_029895 [Lolium multiflorum]
MNYNMQNMNKELPELFSMLKSAEIEIKKEHQVLMVNKTTSFKKQEKPKKGNFKKGGKKAAAPPEKPKAGPKPDAGCYYCKKKGHWKRNCPKYLADLKSGLVKKKKGIFDMHVIDVYLTDSRTSAWTSPEQPQSQAHRRRSSQTIAIDWSSPEPRRGTRVFYTLDNLASTTALDRRRPPALSDPLPRRRSTPFSPVDDDDADRRSSSSIQRSSVTDASTGDYQEEEMEPYVQTETYDLENGGSLVFERDLYLVSEKLERPPPKFHGVRIHNTPLGNSSG